jgi:hypothetical protein
MEIRQIGFTDNKWEEPSLEDHKNNWVLITNGNNTSYAGNVASLNGEWVNFLPYQKTSPNEKGVLEYSIVYEGFPEPHKKRDIISFRSSSEEEVINFCKRMNRKSYLEYLKDRKEICEFEEANSKIKNSLVEIVQN